MWFFAIVRDATEFFVDFGMFGASCRIIFIIVVSAMLIIITIHIVSRNMSFITLLPLKAEK